MTTEMDRLKEENRRLRKEIERLRGILHKHGIQVEELEEVGTMSETIISPRDP